MKNLPIDKKPREMTNQQLAVCLLEALDGAGAMAKIALGIDKPIHHLLKELDRRFVNGWYQRQFEVVNKEWELKLERYEIVKNGDVVREVVSE